MNRDELKNKLKEIPLVYELNARIKSFHLKRSIKKLTKHYDNCYRKQSISYEERSTINEFKNRHLKMQPDFLPKKSGELNIFWVGASRAQDESGFLQALKRLGNVEEFYNIDGEYGPLYEKSGLDWLKVREANDDSLLKQVTKASLNGDIDILIGQMWAHIFSENALLRIRALGIPIINIAMDDRLPDLWLKKDGYRMGSVGLGSGVDLTLTTAPEACRWYAVEKMPALFWPLASDEKLFLNENNSNKDINILFIGNRYGIRGKLIDYLKRRGIQVSCYGKGWENGFVDADENIRLSKSALIILGIGVVGHTSDVYTLKLRDFDALMTGALYITHRNPDLLKLFKEGVHLECYKDAEELYTKLSFYIKNPKKCFEIGKNGNQIARKKHTWDHRLFSTLKKLGLLY